MFGKLVLFTEYTAMYDVVAREGLERRTDRPPNDPTFENRDDRVIKVCVFSTCLSVDSTKFFYFSRNFCFVSAIYLT